MKKKIDTTRIPLTYYVRLCVSPWHFNAGPNYKIIIIIIIRKKKKKKKKKWNNLQKKKWNLKLEIGNRKLEIGNRKLGIRLNILDAHCQLLTTHSLQSITYPISPVFFFAYWISKIKKSLWGGSFEVQVLKPQGFISLPGAHFFLLGIC